MILDQNLTVTDTALSTALDMCLPKMQSHQYKKTYREDRMILSPELDFV